MKAEIKMFVILNLFAIIVWGCVGGAYGAYQAFAEMRNIPLAIASWCILVALIASAIAVEYRVLQSLTRLILELYRWIELMRLSGGKW